MYFPSFLIYFVLLIRSKFIALYLSHASSTMTQWRGTTYPRHFN